MLDRSTGFTGSLGLHSLMNCIGKAVLTHLQFHLHQLNLGKGIDV
ncbi:hypothetical protein CLOSTMETH_01637 [[Clostridium] methylpentosum DSM 5476]|uniref:Uncharacterized protein n=1 Tax=[Clostridium] methylpentosum DSM 5476 TaxID=537013 RepID=C0ECR6_9FIRM|nr:hypothetical protein CLOSTMETH_01637 [[Clostridium] methylpentosum DSM 5476]